MQQPSIQIPEESLQTHNETITKPTEETPKSSTFAYKTYQSFPNSPSFSEVRAERNLYKPFQHNPGPGKYESKSYIQDGPKKSFSARFLEYKKMTPGPLDYNNDTTKVKRKAPTLSMSEKYKSQKELIFQQNAYKPSPTNYQKKGTFEKKKGFFIASSKRKDLTETEKTPGPSYYKVEKYQNIQNNQNHQFKIGVEERKTTEFMKVQLTPGPNRYENKHYFQDDAEKEKGFSFRKRLTDLAAKEIAQYPGPGKYENVEEKEQDTKPNLNQQERKTFMDDMETFSKQYPGPGKHHPSHSLTQISEPSYVFSQIERKPLDEYEKTPGPGYYSEKMNLSFQGPSYTISRTATKNAYLEAINPQNPGPGSYESNISSFSKAQKTTVPKKITKRFGGKQRYTPGPGSYSFYERESPSSPSWKFATGKRTAFTDVKSEGKNQYQSILKKFMGSPKNTSFIKQMKEGSVKSSQEPNKQV